jgi:hypothetical protein
LQRAAEAIDRPCHDDIEPTASGVLVHGVEATEANSKRCPRTCAHSGMRGRRNRSGCRCRRRHRRRPSDDGFGQLGEVRRPRVQRQVQCYQERHQPYQSS